MFSFIFFARPKAVNTQPACGMALFLPGRAREKKGGMKCQIFTFAKGKQNEAKERAPVNLAFGYPRASSECGGAANSPAASSGIRQRSPFIRIQSFRSAALNGMKTEVLHALIGLTCGHFSSRRHDSCRGFSKAFADSQHVAFQKNDRMAIRA